MSQTVQVVRSSVELFNKLFHVDSILVIPYLSYAAARNGGGVQPTLNLKTSELQLSYSATGKFSKNPRETAVHELKDSRQLT